MNTLYFDCAMGAAGDMLLAALYELLPQPDTFLEAFSQLGLPKIRLTAIPSTSWGVKGTHMAVEIDGVEEGKVPPCHAHTHSHSASEIRQIIESLPISQPVRHHAFAVYDSIARAESAVHQVPVTQIHFHEVGTWDAIADVVGTCMLIAQLDPQEILCSPIHVGSGQVHCAHGWLPVPAPATQQLLQGLSFSPGPVTGELCTPTGAALLRHFVTRFSAQPSFVAAKTGCGIGSKDFGVPNVLRAQLGHIAN